MSRAAASDARAHRLHTCPLGPQHRRGAHAGHVGRRLGQARALTWPLSESRAQGVVADGPRDLSSRGESPSVPGELCESRLTCIRCCPVRRTRSNLTRRVSAWTSCASGRICACGQRRAEPSSKRVTRSPGSSAATSRCGRYRRSSASQRLIRPLLLAGASVRLDHAANLDEQRLRGRWRDVQCRASRCAVRNSGAVLP